MPKCVMRATASAHLADHKVPPSGGRLTVARRIWDRIDGRFVMPWEIKPGELVRIVGVHSRPDALNAFNEALYGRNY